MIKLKNIYKEYTMGSQTLQVLKDINLNVSEGEYVSIIGPSGSGKSTMMNILGCLDVPTSGNYFLGGEDVSGYSENQLADIRNKKIGFIFQKFNLLPKLNAYENVELPLIYKGMPAKERKKIVLRNLDIVGLSNRLDHKPVEMSGGQQQRVAIARSLVCTPQIIMADEPTGNLDSKSGKDVMKILKELNQNGRTIILITHDLEVAKMGTRTVTIFDGKIVKEKGLNHEL